MKPIVRGSEMIVNNYPPQSGAQNNKMSALRAGSVVRSNSLRSSSPPPARQTPRRDPMPTVEERNGPGGPNGELGGGHHQHQGPRMGPPSLARPESAMRQPNMP